MGHKHTEKGLCLGAGYPYIISVTHILIYVFCFVLVLGLAGSAVAGPGPVPAPWVNQDIGTTGGSATYDPFTGEFVIIGDGAGIWDASDEFHFVSQQHSGNCMLIARVVSFPLPAAGSNTWQKAGVMIRETLNADSRFVSEVITGGNGGGEAFQWRKVADSGCGSSNVHSGVAPPQWVKLCRYGDTFFAYFAPDNGGIPGQWVQEGGYQTIQMTDPVEVGLCVTSCSSDVLATAAIDNWTLIPEFPEPIFPNPPHRATGVSVHTDISWTPGDLAATTNGHHVYFGTWPTPGAPEYKDIQTPNTYEPGPLDYYTTYYWQIVEVNGPNEWSGPIWSFTTLSLKAYDPDPYDTAPDVPTAKNLSWKAGFSAVGHDVYFGTDFNDVNDADTTVSLGVYKGPTTGSSYPVSGLVGDTTYYWRIDEVNDACDAGPWKGDVWRFTTLSLKAYDPDPYDTAPDVPTAKNLSWKAGSGAASHDVYFATSSPLGPDDRKSTNQAGTTYDLGVLAPSTRYCWRIDEVQGDTSRVPGDVWSFTVRNYLVVDDMEDYNATDLIYDTWKDGPSNGTGSLVALESTPVHEDAQSMRFDYSNSSTPYTSEAQADVDDLPIDSNWAAAGVKALTLCFYGYLHNSIEPMWVELRDTSGNSAKIPYGYYSDENPNDINEASWHEWNIDLEEFVDSNGVSLTDVNDITIGFGDGAPGGGSGTLYFDDIRLYPPRCVLDKRDPNFATFDYAPIGPGGDCVIDAKELDVMFGDWLDRGSTIYATAPNTPVACYDMEGDFNDRCGPYDGDPCNGAYMAYDATLNSNVAVFDGADDFVELGTWNPSAATGQLGLCVWAQWHGNDQGRWNGIMGKRDNWSASNMMWQIEIDGNNGRTGFFRNGSDGTGKPYTMPVNEWVHIAVSFDGTTAIFYANGVEQGRGGFSFGAKTDSHLTFGCGQQNGGNPFYGKLDDVKVFDYGLSQSDILSVAGLSDLYIELTSAANIYDKEPKHSKVVNFKDYALVAERFLDEDMFP